MSIFKRKKKLTVCTIGHAALSKSSIPVEDRASEQEFAAQLIDAMYKNDGIGLAAPQVGRNIQMFALAVPEGDKQLSSPGEISLLPRMPLVFINPSFTPTTTTTEASEEGCLSIPYLYAEVERPVSIMFQAQLINGEHINIECSGLLARAIQHECDHLDGVLFVDRLKDEELAKVKNKVDRLKKQGKKRAFLRK
jgi:peptide deformylase